MPGERFGTVPPINPEQTSGSTPEALFAQQVEDVRRMGDAISEQHTLKPTFDFFLGGATGLAGGMLAKFEAMPASLIVPVAGAIAAGVVAAGAAEMMASRYANKAEKAYGYPVQNALRARYDLYVGESSGSATLTMHLEGFPQDTVPDPKEHLRYLIGLAIDNKIDLLALSPGVAYSCFRNIVLPKPVPFAAMVENYTGVPVETRASGNPIFIHPPQTWEKLIASSANNSEESAQVRKGYSSRGWLTPEFAGHAAITEAAGLDKPVAARVRFLEHDTESSVTRLTPQHAGDSNTWPRVRGRTAQEQLALRIEPGDGPRITRADRKKRWKHRIQGLVVGMVFLGGAVTWSADSVYETKRDEVATRIAIQDGADPNVANVSPQVIDQHMGIWAEWAEWYRIRTRLYHTLGLDKSGGAGMNPTYSGIGVGETGIGNIDAQDFTPLWHIEAHGLSSGGYWTQEIMNELSGSVPTKDQPAQIQWHDTQDYTKTDSLGALPTALPENYSQWLRVSRNVNIADVALSIKQNVLIPIPVKDNTRPIAASYNGKPAVLRQTQAGTYVLQLPGDVESNGILQYWLGDLGPDYIGPQPHALGALQTTGSMFNKYTGPRLAQTFADNVPGWSERNLSGINTGKTAIYLRGFRYQLAPLRQSAYWSMHNMADFAEYILDAHATNCNTASTVGALQDSSQNAEVGFLNNGGAGSNVLTSSEAHMTLVNHFGKRTDMTPPGWDQAPEKPTPFDPWFMLPGLLLGAGGMQWCGGVILYMGQRWLQCGCITLQLAKLTAACCTRLIGLQSQQRLHWKCRGVNKVRYRVRCKAETALWVILLLNEHET